MGAEQLSQSLCSLVLFSFTSLFYAHIFIASLETSGVRRDVLNTISHRREPGSLLSPEASLSFVLRGLGSEVLIRTSEDQCLPSARELSIFEDSELAFPLAFRGSRLNLLWFSSFDSQTPFTISAGRRTPGPG